MSGLDKEKRLIDCFNEFFKQHKFTYGQLNTFFDLTKEKDKLHLLEKKYSELGLAGKEGEGVSVISLFATITDFLCEKRFAVIIDNDKESDLLEKDRIIKGVSLCDFKNEKMEDIS